EEGRVGRLPARLGGKPSEQAPVLHLERQKLRERRLERQALPVTAVNAGHQRLDERVVRLMPEAAGKERRDRLIAARRSGWKTDLGCQPLLARFREQRAPREGVEIGGDQPGQTLGERMQLVASPHVREGVLGAPADQLADEPELLAQPHSALLAGEEAV